MSPAVLTRYLTRMFVVRCLAVLLALSALLQLLDLLDAASSVLSRGGGVMDLLRYTGLRLPLVVERLVPLSVLIGTLSTLWSLASTNEIVAMRSIGLTPYQLLGTLMPAALVVALLHLLLADQVAPRTERAFLDWWASTTEPGDEPEAPKPLWFRLDGSVISVRSVAAGERRLDGVEVFHRDGLGRVTEKLTAARAERGNDGRWVLEDGTRTPVAVPLKTEHFERLDWEISLTPANIRDLQLPAENISVLRLRSILRGGWAGLQSSAYYTTRLHETYAGPLSTLVMVLLAAPVAHGLRRRGGAVGSLALGIVIGLAFLVTNGALAAMGQAGAVPPVIAVWAPTLFFAAVGGAILVHVEQ
ncbi:LPS export ABC transporter permease LptG [Oleisolibacter albus]|uniref:LPS export ABC transporter permease LptG n=1 Tax=Oleisolibacter albus TaxID=2171757 RepID=UPI000DF14DE2|nr:LPS export ABC transporter permease LptG [Oleisolibacter albus]